MIQSHSAAAAPQGLAMLIAAAPFCTQEAGDESPRKARLRACQMRADAAECLARYVTLCDPLIFSSDRGTIKNCENAALRQKRRKSIEGALPDMSMLRAKSDKQEPEQADQFPTFETTVAGVRSAKGKMIVTTAESADWQLDAVLARLMFTTVGQTRRISSGALGNYFLHINSQEGSNELGVTE
jgi:hypothetical protein